MSTGLKRTCFILVTNSPTTASPRCDGPHFTPSTQPVSRYLVVCSPSLNGPVLSSGYCSIASFFPNHVKMLRNTYLIVLMIPAHSYGIHHELSSLVLIWGTFRETIRIMFCSKIVPQFMSGNQVSFLKDQAKKTLLSNTQPPPALASGPRCLK